MLSATKQMIEQKTVRNLSDANCKTSPVLETSDHGLNPVATLPFPTDVFERFLPPPWKAAPNCLFLPKYNWKTQRVVD